MAESARKGVADSRPAAISVALCRLTHHWEEKLSEVSLCNVEARARRREEGRRSQVWPWRLRRT